MSTAPKRSTAERLAGRAALGALRVIEAAFVAAGYAAKGWSKVIGPGKAVRELREREAAEARRRQEEGPERD